MTSFCNIFKPIDSPTGNFLLFSQYAEDLSRSVVDPNYKVRPSRFVCMDLDTNDIDNIYSYGAKLVTTSVTDANSFVPQLFQDSFENAIAVAKNTDDLTYSLHNFSTEFWYHMGMVTADIDGLFGLHNKVNYIHDIDLSSWENGFADIILNINSGATKQKYEVNKTPDSNRDWSDIDNFRTDCGVWSFEQKNMIEGWTSDQLTNYISGELKEGYSNSSGYGKYTLNDENHNSTVDPDGSNADSIIDNMIAVKPWADGEEIPTSFKFNTIVILYDILTPEPEGDSIIAKDIPMGIYFTGDVDDSTHTINNPVTIYSSSADAYGAGTGWSLRISTRFSPTPLGLTPIEPIALESGDALYQTISAQMAAVAELIKAERDGLKNVTTVSQNFADFVNEFKNTRQINVPYIVDGYWFVNGGNTGQPANALGVEEASDQAILSVLDS